jgi:hypothetical protein
MSLSSPPEWLNSNYNPFMYKQMMCPNLLCKSECCIYSHSQKEFEMAWQLYNMNIMSYTHNIDGDILKEAIGSMRKNINRIFKSTSCTVDVPKMIKPGKLYQTILEGSEAQITAAHTFLQEEAPNFPVLSEFTRKLSSNKQRHMDVAVNDGNLEMVQFLHGIGVSCAKNAMENAVLNGHLEVVKFLHSIGCPFGHMDKYHAIQNGHLGIVQFLHSVGCMKAGIHEIDNVALHGHLDVVKFLHSVGATCTDKAMDYAAWKGHLAVVQFLHSIGAPIAANAMDVAARNGHLAVVQFLHGIGGACTDEAMDFAADNDHHAVVQFLHSIASHKEPIDKRNPSWRKQIVCQKCPADQPSVICGYSHSHMEFEAAWAPTIKAQQIKEAQEKKIKEDAPPPPYTLPLQPLQPLPDKQDKKKEIKEEEDDNTSTTNTTSGSTTISKKKPAKEKIPSAVKRIVWNTYIGKDHLKGKCLCCNAEEVTASNFECGHVKSEKNGGLVTVDNLRPICSNCNKSVGGNDMDDFMKRYKIKTPKNWNGLIIS